MELAKIIQLELAMLCCAALTSCGGGIGVPVSTPVTGYISKGPVDGATCSLYNSSHQAVAGPVISNKGALDFGKITASGALTIECTGGTYTDEVTGNTANSGSLNSGVTVTQGTPIIGVVTPLTHMAYTRAAGDATQIAAKAKEVADALGLSDVDLLATTPTDVNTQAADNDAAGKYGTMLATVSQYMKDNNLDLTSAIILLTNAVDTTGVSATMQMSLQTSVTNLATSGKAKDNVAKIKDDVKNAIKRGTESGLSLTAASPAVLIQGAPGSSNWTIAGTGFLKSGGAVVIKLDGTACASSGTVISFVTITGVDCSNVKTRPTATTATLSLTATATGATAQPPEQMLSIKLTNDIGASYQLTVNKTIPTLSIAPSLSLYLIDDAPGKSIAAPLAAEARNGLNKPTGSVIYTSSNPAVATVDSTGKIIPISPGTVTITANYAGDANYANKESQSMVTVLGATTANFIGVNWADRRDNFVDDLLLLSGLSANDNQATITAKTATILAGFKATGVNTLRLPVNPTTVLQSYWPKYSSIIDQASNNNMKVLVAYWEGASSKDGLVDGDGSAFWSMWDTLVAKYKDNPNIYFEVMNEPYGYDITSLKNLYADWLDRYPSLPRGRVVLGGARYSENVNAIGADTRFAECRLSFHFYVWWRRYWSVAEWETPIRDYVNYPQRTILTEFGIPVQDGGDYWTITTSPTQNIAFMQGMTNSVRTKNMGSLYWPGLRTNDSYSIFTYNGTSLDVVNASALRRVQYGWGLP